MHHVIDFDEPYSTASFFHIVFKAAALLVYEFGGIFTSSFILIFVFCVLFLAFDFWVVKNVSGRLLVGLRWWNEVLDDGTNKWIYESKPDSRVVNTQDSLVFWAALWATPILWLVFGFVAFISFEFKWLLIVTIALLLSAANLLGYWKCEKHAKSKIQSFLTSRLASAATAGALGGGGSSSA
jgi:hypothetical protein